MQERDFLWCGRTPDGELLISTLNQDPKIARQKTVQTRKNSNRHRIAWPDLKDEGYVIVRVHLTEGKTYGARD
jgi:hypothetical protein